MLSYGFFSWFARLQNNWEKEDIRGAVKAWYLNQAYEDETFVYYGADSGFAYYLRQNDSYMEALETKVHYMKWMRNKSIDKYTDYIDKVYGNDWPSVIYVVASHTRDDWNTILESITAKGYSQEVLFDSMDGHLLRMIYIGEET